MATAKVAHVAPWKREKVDRIAKMVSEYPVLGIIEISELPARQFQQIRQKLRGEASIVITRNTLLKIALGRAAENNSKIGELNNLVQGEVGLVLTKLNPFKLSTFLRDNRVKAPARPGSKSPSDITIPAGETDLPPGPVVGELQKVGLKARIQAGKVVILEDHKLLKEGDVITKELSDILAKFGIMPLELGIGLRAALEGSMIYSAEILKIDQKQVLSQFQEAGAYALNLAVNIDYPTSETVGIFLAKAAISVRNLAITARIPVKGVIPEILSIARGEMLSLATVIRGKNEQALDDELKGILGTAPAAPVDEKPKEGEKPKKEEKPKEEKKEEEMAGLGALFG